MLQTQLKADDSELESASGTLAWRKALWSAVRRSPWLRQCYERLGAAGKPCKVAVIAAMRKLLARSFGV
jgi:hypothetical protein